MVLKRLIIENVADVFVLAISCHQKSVRLVWELNKAFDCELKSSENYEDNIYFISQIKGHTYFKLRGPENRFYIHLLKNRGEKGLLIPAQKQIDFFYILTGFYQELNLHDIIEKVKAIPNVLTAFPIKIDKK